MNLYELLAEVTARHPSKLAVISAESSTTYLGLLKAIDSLAEHYMVSMGRFTEEVFLHTALPSNLESVVKLFAAAKLGIGVMPSLEDVNMLRSSASMRDEAERPYLLLETSGTTGKPKLISLPQRVKLARASQATALYDVTADDYILAGTPLHHSLAQRLVFTALLNGAAVEVLPKYSMQLWLAALRRSTFTICVPVQLRGMVEAKPDCPRLRMVVSSSAPLAPLIGEELMYWYHKTEFHECYGASEVAVAASKNMRCGTGVGGYLDDVALRIDPLLKEVQVKSPFAFAGYAGSPELTQQAHTADGYFRMGDSGFITDTGMLHLNGRLNDRIKVGAVSVWPEAVDAALIEAGYENCAAFGASDEVLGEVVAVAIAGQPDVTLRQIQHACHGRLEDSEMPRKLVHVKALPYTITGKLLRRNLKC